MFVCSAVSLFSANVIEKSSLYKYSIPRLLSGPPHLSIGKCPIQTDDSASYPHSTSNYSISYNLYSIL